MCCRVGVGNDTIAGGLGIDTADWTTARRSIVFTLAADGSGVTANVVGINVDTLTGIENLSGGTAADQLTGNDGNNELNGNGNADILNGAGGQ